MFKMKLGSEILLRTVVVTVIYAPVFAFSLLASALIVQSHVHPDSWVTTKYDIATGVIVALLYLVTLVLQVKSAIKKHSNKVG
jgi:hypothetical protein